ncbi:hypothetical protein [Enterococcus sp. 5B3_DIV0040]|uniref:hypothetical protein n=1 Tax=Enterococcus sp. 5B3_DIV0040 TaxID=1834182 RepID=UPI000A35A75E|nr:hypothetical protein [Enterococcus sp. 5B3_DIV0040]OTO05342.1 hypothetical protein A5883_002334 [Enterococcus sp. 5B3_DIV0040]
MGETPVSFGKVVKSIYDSFLPEQQELMKFFLKSMLAYVKQTGDITGKEVEYKFRKFMFLHRY